MWLGFEPKRLVSRRVVTAAPLPKEKHMDLLRYATFMTISCIWGGWREIEVLSFYEKC